MQTAIIENKTIRRLEWVDVTTCCQTIARSLRSVSIESIVAVSRGGLAPAAMLAHMLNVRDVRTIAVQSYDDNGKQSPATIDWEASATSLRDSMGTLFVDDISDTGRTRRLVAQHFPKSRFAALVIRENADLENLPDLWGRSVEVGAWIEFPWEIASPWW